MACLCVDLSRNKHKNNLQERNLEGKEADFSKDLVSSLKRDFTYKRVKVEESLYFVSILLI